MISKQNAQSNRRRLVILILATKLTLLSITNAEPLFENSVVSNDLDFITVDDPVAPFEIEFVERAKREMPDKLSDQLFENKVYVFKTIFEDNATIQFWCDPEFPSADAAKAFVNHVSEAIGKQPLALRKGIAHVVIHRGDETAFAEEKGHFFVLYTENINKRISTHDLEETIFHETIHAVLEDALADSPEWLAAQKKDAKFITAYAARLPKKEDLPESALFAYTLLKHPGRLPSAIETNVRKIMPARLDFFRELFSSWEKKQKN